MPDPPRSRLALRFGQDARQPQSTGAVVQGVLHAGSLTLTYGPPKSGKSFLMTDLFVSIAAGDESWMDRPIVRPGPVVYVTCEGHAGFWKRLEAINQTRGYFPDHFVLAIGRPVLISIGKTGIALPQSEDVERAVADVRRTLGVPPIAVCIDTVFRSFAPGNVNSSDHMMAYVSAFQKIIDTGIAGVLVHHATKSAQSPAGSVALIGAADTVIATNGDAEGHTWEIEMAKDDGETLPRKFVLDIKEIGADPDGQPATSCVVRDLEETVPRTKGRPKMVAERDLLMRLLAETMDERGHSPNGGVPPMIGRVCEAAHWREKFMTRCRPDDPDNTKRTAFRRMVRDLQAANRIGVAGSQVWPIH